MADQRGGGIAWTATALVDLLRAKYPSNAYTVLEQVRDDAGFGARRTGDVMVMGLWPSRGLELQGFEVKVSRADWLRETKTPEKAESLYAYCDRWWLLASDAGIVQDMELPPTWGLVVPRGRGLGVVTQAPKLEPASLDRGLLAALLKRAWSSRPESAMLAEAKASGRKEGERAAERAKEDLAELGRELAEFEAASGLRISQYCGGRALGEAVRLLGTGPGNPVGRLVRLRAELRRLADDLDKIAEVSDG